MTVTSGAGAVGQRLHGRREAAVGEHRRGNPARQVAQLSDRRGRLLAGAANQLGGLGLILEPLLGAAELDAERDQPRLGAVVQVALDPAQLGALDVERAAAGAGQLLHADLELARLGPAHGGVDREQPAERDQREDRPEQPAA